MKNPITAFPENRYQLIDLLRVFDNSENFGRPHLVLSMVRGVPRNIAAARKIRRDHALAKAWLRRYFAA